MPLTGGATGGQRAQAGSRRPEPGHPLDGRHYHLLPACLGATRRRLRYAL